MLRRKIFMAMMLVGLFFVSPQGALSQNTDTNENELSDVPLIENPPIPPRRPAVFHASPGYIEKLRARALTPSPVQHDESFEENTLKEVQVIEINKEKELTPVQAAPVTTEELDTLLVPADIDQKAIEDSLELSLKTPSRQDILNAIEQTSKKSDTKRQASEEEKSIKITPIPKKKPELLQTITPAAGETDEPTSFSSTETSKLISFYLQPSQIHLDDNLTSFLQNHALRALGDDKTLIIEIHAYATPISGEEHSDARISLARALEVRSFLMKNHIDPARMRLKPLPQNDKNEASDRIDLMFIKDL